MLIANLQLAQREEHIEDLQPDLANGVHLITLIEVLTQKRVQMKWTKKPIMKAHKITNCVVALDHLKGEVGSHFSPSFQLFTD
jgi:hypothetical protein